MHHEFSMDNRERLFWKTAVYIKAHVGLYCFWHLPPHLKKKTGFCQTCFLYVLELHTIGWRFLQTLSRGLSGGWACMRSQYENMAWMDFYFSKWSHSLKALIILTEEYNLSETLQEKKNKIKSTVKGSGRSSHAIIPLEKKVPFLHHQMDIQSAFLAERYMRKPT